MQLWAGVLQLVQGLLFELMHSSCMHVGGVGASAQAMQALTERTLNTEGASWASSSCYKTRCLASMLLHPATMQCVSSSSNACMHTCNFSSGCCEVTGSWA
jgi:hypothetical protein